MQEFEPPASIEFDPRELEEARKTLTPLQFAIDYGTFEDMKKALKDNPESINKPTTDGDTPLHWSVHHGKIKEVKLLLDSGADLNANGDHGRTPLHTAISNGEFEIASLLLSKGADPNKVDFGDNAPLSYARKARFPEEPDLFKLLVEYGATIDLPIVMELGDFERARQMLKKDPKLVSSLRPKIKKRILSSGINMISHKHDLEMEKKYGLPLSPPITSSDEFKQQFGGEVNQHLRKLIRENRDILETLIFQGAPRSIPNLDLDLALMNDQEPLVELLLEYGAEFPAEDDEYRWGLITGPNKLFGLTKMDKAQIIEKYKRYVKKQSD